MSNANIIFFRATYISGEASVNSRLRYQLIWGLVEGIFFATVITFPLTLIRRWPESTLIIKNYKEIIHTSEYNILPTKIFFRNNPIAFNKYSHIKTNYVPTDNLNVLSLGGFIHKIFTVSIHKLLWEGYKFAFPLLSRSYWGIYRFGQYRFLQSLESDTLFIISI